MEENEYGEYSPVLLGDCPESCSFCLQVCPFSNDHGENEDTLGERLFGLDESCRHHDTMGWVRDSYVGAVADERERLKAPSGGLATAVLCELLRQGRIDAAIVPQPLRRRPWFQMRIVSTEREILASRGSVYHMLHLADGVLRQVVTGQEKRYAVVALPCVAKGLRLAQKHNPKLRRRIRYIFGLTCGGQRSLKLADMLTALSGSKEGTIVYRNKHGARSASDTYTFAMLSPDGIRRAVRGFLMFFWMNEIGALKPCLFCEDVFAELADATFMDAWLPEYASEKRGTSLVVSRRKDISNVLRSLFSSEVICGGSISPESVARSQLHVVRKKRRKLAAIVELAGRKTYVPRKRLKADGVEPAEKHLECACRELRLRARLREYLSRCISTESGRIGTYLTCWKIAWLIYRSGLPLREGRALLFLCGTGLGRKVRKLLGR